MLISVSDKFHAELDRAYPDAARLLVVKANRSIHTYVNVLDRWRGGRGSSRCGL